MHQSMNFLIRSIGPALLLALSMTASAQWTLPNAGCSIRYAHDAAGNRTARFWYCWEGLGPESMMVNADDPQEKPIDRKVHERVLEHLELGLYPNPSSDGITITLSEAVGNVGYSVYDAKGRSMLHGIVQGSRLDINTSDFAAGLYNQWCPGKVENVSCT